MDPHDQRILWSSKETDYRTPPQLYAALNQEFGFLTDIAATRENRMAAVWAGPDAPSAAYRDALAPGFDWGLLGPVWCNPPYSKRAYREGKAAGAPHRALRALLIQNWTARCAREASQGTVVVAILPAAIQSQWWAQDVWGGILPAREVRFIPHRVSFLGPEGQPLANAGVNHCIVIWTPNPGYVGSWTPVVRYWDYRR